jgi:hypothetical protein
MKIKVLIGILFVAGVAAALAVATPTRADNGTTAAATTTTTTGEHKNGKQDDGDEKDKPKKSCQNVSLKGGNGSGSVALTVTKADHKGSSLVGKQVTLTIAAGATLNAKACLDSSGALTLRQLHVDAKHMTTTTSAGTTTAH